MIVDSQISTGLQGLALLTSQGKKMLLKKIVLLLAVSVVFASSAFAAGKKSEFSMGANYIDVQGQGSASMLNVSLGQFLTPQVVLGTTLTSQRNYGYTGTAISLGGKFFFMDGFRGDLVPFAGLGLGLRQASTATNGTQGSTQYDLLLGVSFFMSDSTTIDAKLDFLNYNDSSPSITVFSAGFSQRF